MSTARHFSSIIFLHFSAGLFSLTATELLTAPSAHRAASPHPPPPVCPWQVQQSQEKIARLEQEKEHWLLEAQLGKVRLEKENQRIADLESQLAAAFGGGAASPPPLPAATLAPSQEEAEGVPGKEATLCTSLVSGG